MKLVDDTFPIAKRIVMDSKKPLLSSDGETNRIVLSQGEAAWVYGSGVEPNTPEASRLSCKPTYGHTLDLGKRYENQDTDKFLSDEFSALAVLSDGRWERTEYTDGTDVRSRCSIASYSNYQFKYKQLNTGNLVGEKGLKDAFSDFGNQLSNIYNALFDRSSKSSPLMFYDRKIRVEDKLGLMDTSGSVSSSLEMRYGVESHYDLTTSKRHYNACFTNGGDFYFLDSEQNYEPTFFYIPLIRDYFELEIDFSFECPSVFDYQLAFSNEVRVVPCFDVYVPKSVVLNTIDDEQSFKIYCTYRLPSIQLSLGATTTEYSSGAFRARVAFPTESRFIMVMPYLRCEIPSFESLAGLFAYKGGASPTDAEWLYHDVGTGRRFVDLDVSCNAGQYHIGYCGPWRGGTPSGSPVIYE